MWVLLGLLLLFVAAVAFAFTQLAPERAARLVLRLTRRMLGLRESSLRVNGLRIAYFEAGIGEPLVLLHGMGADKDNFLKIAPPLAKRYHVIVPDLPGFGDSDKPQDRRYGIAEQIENLHAFVTKLGLGPFDLGGNSMGGFIAGAYAARYPEQVSSLWLLAPAGVLGAKPTELMRSMAAGTPLPIFGRNVDDMRRIIRFATFKPPFIPDFLIRAMAMEQDRQYEFNQRVVQQLLDGPGLDALLATTQVRVPTLIVWGEHDRALDVSGADILHRLLPRSQVRRMAEVGHIPQIEAPVPLVRDYLEFRQNAA